ncbi:hypothetical protein HPB50_025446 [Hyalomma asiaticum]|uniref:Uncharacterized protein n=1 Tax=Hyalomma asiaticum TaxID=266040 RepID=A0ACB7RKR0_HYAAI|nr:hypothetical protein HPB50_025446 [Hyalomma asiaticum]
MKSTSSIVKREDMPCSPFHDCGYENHIVLVQENECHLTMSIKTEQLEDVKVKQEPSDDTLLFEEQDCRIRVEEPLLKCKSEAEWNSSTPDVAEQPLEDWKTEAPTIVPEEGVKHAENYRLKDEAQISSFESFNLAHTTSPSQEDSSLVLRSEPTESTRTPSELQHLQTGTCHTTRNASTEVPQCLSVSRSNCSSGAVMYSEESIQTVQVHCQKGYSNKLCSCHLCTTKYNSGLGVKCSYCSQTFAIKQALESHVHDQHSGKKPFKCDLCDKTFRTPSVLTVLERLCKDLGPSGQGICSFFDDRVNLIADMKVATRINIAKCLEKILSDLRTTPTKAIVYFQVQAKVISASNMHKTSRKNKKARKFIQDSPAVKENLRGLFDSSPQKSTEASVMSPSSILGSRNINTNLGKRPCDPCISSHDRVNLIADMKVATRINIAKRLEKTPQETPDDVSRGIINGLIPGMSTAELAAGIQAPARYTVLHARMLGQSTMAVVFIEGLHVSYYIVFQSVDFRCKPYRKSVQYCRTCGNTGHRQDICPRPIPDFCYKCGKAGQTQDHECKPTCRICGEGHETAGKECKKRLKPSPPPYHIRKQRLNKLQERDCQWSSSSADFPELDTSLNTSTNSSMNGSSRHSRSKSIV